MPLIETSLLLHRAVASDPITVKALANVPQDQDIIHFPVPVRHGQESSQVVWQLTPIAEQTVRGYSRFPHRKPIPRQQQPGRGRP